MPHHAIHSRLQNHFPVLYSALAQLPASAYQLIQAPADTTLFDIGGACEQYLLITRGSVSVKMLSRSGKSILLYRVLPGQSCIITTSCLLGNARYPTFGQAETDIEALSLSQDDFSHALDQCSAFRGFVFDGLSQRLADVMQRLESVNFTSIDHRLAVALLARHQGTNKARIEATHEALAEEVGTAREVVSRHLKKMEHIALITLERGGVVINDVEGLSALRDDH